MLNRKITLGGSQNQTRRRFMLASGAVVLTAGASALLGGFGQGPSEAAAQGDLIVWKSRTCSCCGGWVSHVRAEGFAVKVIDLDDLDPIKTARRIPEGLLSCHTAEIQGYVVEGHVPTAAIRQLLADRPELDGIALAGMPSGSPGMGGPAEVLTVVGFRDGKPTGPFWEGAV